MLHLADMWTYPFFDPVALSLGPLKIRWYGMRYLLAFATAWWLARRRARRPDSGWTPVQVDDLIFYGAMGIILGGRLGYMLFYGGAQILENPLSILKIWEGGMSFHGGLLGTLLALWWFGQRTQRSLFEVGDFVAPLVPLGLGFGRLGNFANTELPGRMTDSTFGMIYPCSADAIRSINQLCVGEWETFARHPSPLYQAFAEGLILFGVVWLVASSPRKAGVVSGVFVATYGALR
ncbi:MAG: prolipoprotein diacylglyceryl transferase, partial [Gammaproteobacteria bacterium]